MATIALTCRINRTVYRLAKRHIASTVTKCDALVLGGGIGGASTSYQLAKLKNLKVICIEKEQSAGYHATGQAHGMFSSNLARTNTGKILTKHSRSFFKSPPPECIDESIKNMNVLKQVGLMAIASPFDYPYIYKELGPRDKTNKLQFDENIKVLPRSDVMNYLPFLNASELAEYGIYEADACDFNTDLAYKHFLFGSVNVGVEHKYNSIAVEITKQHNGNWEVTTFNSSSQTLDRFEAPLIINCSGQWSDEITVKAGLSPINIIKNKRHVIVFSYGSDDLETEMAYHAQLSESKKQTPWVGWISTHVHEIFYSSFHKNSGVFLFEKYITHHDDIDHEEHDENYVVPDEDDEMHICLHKIHKYTNLKVKEIGMKTAGIKAQVEDDLDIVVGPHKDDNSFIIVGALGSIGIQGAPAYSEVAACLAVNDNISTPLLDLGIDIHKISPLRLP